MEPNYFALSFVGRRNSNQDAVLTLRLNDSSYFIAVADGMGGATSGHVASQTVLREAEKFLKRAFAKDPNPKDLKNVLKKTFATCQKAVADAIRNNPELSGMGTTLACVLICENRFVVGNIGDSRVYKYYSNELVQITEDHTHIQDYLKKEGGVISPQIQAQYSSFLTRCIDGGEDTPDIFPAENEYDVLLPGMAFLVCSDGLILDKSATDTSLLKDLYLGTKSLKKAAENMIAYAFQAGSDDNITIALFEYGAIPGKKNKRLIYKYPSDEKRLASQAKSSESFSVKMLIIATIILFLIILTSIIFNKSLLNIFEKKSQVATSKIDHSSEIQSESIQKSSIPKPKISGDRGDRPSPKNSYLTWDWKGPENELVKYIIFFFSDSLGKEEKYRRETNEKNIQLENIQVGTYYFKVRAITTNDSADSDIKKIIIGPAR